MTLGGLAEALPRRDQTCWLAKAHSLLLLLLLQFHYVFCTGTDCLILTHQSVFIRTVMTNHPADFTGMLVVPCCCSPDLQTPCCAVMVA